MPGRVGWDERSESQLGFALLNPAYKEYPAYKK
jgi:hypothetical protein